MSDFQVRSDSVDVEQIMKQIRARIREKRGSDYTQQELQQLASVKLEQFADPSGLRSDLLEQFRQRSNEPSTYHRYHGVRRWVLMAMHPILKRMQKQVMADLNLYFEIIHNLVVETTRLGIEVQNLKMKVESMSSRLDFDERRAKALEGVVQYRPDAPPRHRPQEPRHQSQEPRHQPQEPRHQPVETTPSVAVSAFGAQAPSTANTGSGAAPQGQPTYGGGARPSEGGRPGDSARPDGARRRRRRRRRRPGQSMGDRQAGPGGASPDAQAPENGGHVSGDADGPDDDGAPDQ